MARLLDALMFDEWLALYAGECIYWVPATPGGGDPRREVAISFDDRRRLEDRIYRLRTGYAWSQAPKSRTERTIPSRICPSAISCQSFSRFSSRIAYWV